jgi:hypothetical protein
VRSSEIRVARFSSAALAVVPIASSAGAVDSRAVERTLLVAFAGFVVVVGLLGLALVAAVSGHHRRRLLRSAVVVETACAVVAVGATILVGAGRDFSRLEQSVLFAGAIFFIVCLALVIHAFLSSRSAGA